MTPAAAITPVMTAQRAREIAAELDLRILPPDFHTDPYRCTRRCAS